MGDGDDQIRYYHDDSVFAYLRRFLIALIFGLMMILGVSGVLQILLLIGPGFAATYKEYVALLPFIPVQAHTIPWSFSTHVVLIVIATGILWGMKIPRAVDFFLFPPYDYSTISPIRRYTGIFKWSLSGSGPQREAWEKLLAWVEKGTGDGRLGLRWVFYKPAKQRTFEPFKWTLLLGPNGVGKSQLAKELGRHLAQRDRFGDSDATLDLGLWWSRMIDLLDCWWRRVAPWQSRNERDPWHAGMVVKEDEVRKVERLERLKNWLPSAPTFLILDDPQGGDSKIVIDLLSARESKFWYPVRLLIVDQFVPTDLPISSYPDRKGWYDKESSLPFAPILLGEERFDAGRYRAALAVGFWFSKKEGLGVAKDELMLMKSEHLKAVYKTEDVESLVSALENNILLLALATIWFAEDPGRTVGQLLKADFLDEEEAAIFNQNHQSLKHLVAHRLISERIQEFYDSCRNEETKNKIDKDALQRSIACASLADGISIKQAREAFHLNIGKSDLKRLFPSLDGVTGSIPPLRPWIFAESFVRKFRAEIMNNPEKEMDILIGHAFAFNAAGVLKVFRRTGRLANEISDSLERLLPPEAEADRIEIFIALAEYTMFVNRFMLPIACQYESYLDDKSISEAVSRLEHSISLRQRDTPYSVPRVTLSLRLIARSLRKDPKNEDIRELALVSLKQLMQTEQAFHNVHQKIRNLLFDAFREVMKLLLEPIFADPHFDLHFNALDKIYIFVIKYLGPDLSEQLTKDVMPQFSDNPHGTIQDFIIELWSIRTLSFSVETHECEQMARNLATQLEKSTLGPSLISLLESRAWGSVAWARSNIEAERHTTEAIARIVDEIAKPFPDNEQIQEERANAWSVVACARSGIEAERHTTEAAARIVDGIAKPFPDNARIQKERATAWRAVAWARSGVEAERHTTEAAARIVDEIAKPFPDNEQIQGDRAIAWRSVAYGRSGIEAERHTTEAAARIVDEIAKPFPHNEEL